MANEAIESDSPLPVGSADSSPVSTAVAGASAGNPIDGDNAGTGQATMTDEVIMTMLGRVDEDPEGNERQAARPSEEGIRRVGRREGQEPREGGGGVEGIDEEYEEKAR